MSHVTTSEARSGFADTLNRVIYRKERVVLQRRGKDVAVIVPIEDLALLEELEDRLDVEAADAALRQARESGEAPLPYEKVREELGL